VNNIEQNFAKCAQYIEEAAAQGCSLICFPECFSFIGAFSGEASSIAEPLDGPVMDKYRTLAREHSIWLSLGGFQEANPNPEDGRTFNTHVVVDNSGEIRSSYRKIHLYDVPMVGLVESTHTLAGDEVVSCASPVGMLGVTICYDMRFPELYQKLTFLHGAEVLLMPSAFAMKTGAAHWETLLRCRAIETQCYVIAAAQVGQHNTNGNKRTSWGHACVFSPWGDKLVDMGTSVGISVFEIDLAEMQRARDNMPMPRHRRYDIYGDGPHQVPESHL